MKRPRFSPQPHLRWVEFRGLWGNRDLKFNMQLMERRALLDKDYMESEKMMGNRTSLLRFLILSLCVIVAASTTHAATLFQDDFDLDPAAAGSTGRSGADPGFASPWTESVTDTGSIDGDINATGGGEARFQSDGLNVDGNDFDTFQITRTINASSFQDLTVELTARDDEDNAHEAADFLRLLVDTGSGFTEVFNQSGDFGGGATSASLTFGPLLLPPGANLSVFDLRIEASSNVEDYFLNQLILEGNQVPEPASVAIWCLLGLLCVGFVWQVGRRKPNVVGSSRVPM